MTNPDTKLYVLPSIFCVNETEASMFTGLPVNDLEYVIYNLTPLNDFITIMDILITVDW